MQGQVAQRRAVTLIELMVVLGIVLVLIAILVPVLAAARRRARDADTLNQLEALRGACEGYHAMFRSYPGPMMESDVAGDIGFTGSQNLGLGLMGTMESKGGNSLTPLVLSSSSNLATIALPRSASNNAYQIYAAEEPRGIKDLSEGLFHAAFYVARGKEFVVAQGARVAGQNLPGTAVKYAPRLSVFFDRYGDALPVLYYRRGASMVNPVVGEAAGSGGYARMSNVAYTDSTTLVSSSGNVYSQATSGYAAGNVSAGVDAGYSTHLEKTLTDQTGETGNSATRKARGSFVLISAGQDRVYGPVIEGGAKVKESDDIVVFGGN